jgi:hypothetical protein
MKRWKFILLITAFFTLGIGLGVYGGRVTFQIAYLMGGINQRAESILETEYFKERVAEGGKFRLGDYTFHALDPKRKVVQVRRDTSGGTRP